MECGPGRNGCGETGADPAQPPGSPGSSLFAGSDSPASTPPEPNQTDRMKGFSCIPPDARTDRDK